MTAPAVPRPVTAPPRRAARLATVAAASAVAPALLAAVLGLWRLGTPVLWADELATWGAVRLPPGELLDLLGGVDAAIGPYYALLSAWVALAGDSAVALRLPSVLAAVAATALVTAIGRRAGGAAAGLLAGLVFAFLPTTSRYAQEARPYAAVMAAAALATLLLLRLVEAPGLRRAAGYAGAVALAGLLHPVGGLLLVAGHGIGVLGARSARTLAHWAAATAAGLVPVAALAVVAAGQTAQVSWISVITWRTLLAVPESVFGAAAVGGLVLALAVAGWRPDPVGGCLAGAAFVPVAVLFAVGVFHPVWVGRYLVVVLPACAVLAGLALAGLRPTRQAGVVLLAAALALPAQLTIRGAAGHGQASDRVAQVIRARPGDVLVFPDTHRSIPWAGRDVVARYLPADRRPPDALAVAPPRTDGRLAAVECPGASCLGTPPRIWLVRTDDVSDPLRDMSAAKRAVLARYEVRQRWQYPLLGIYLLEPR